MVEECRALSIAKKPDFQTFSVGFYQLFVIRRSDFTLSVQVGVHPGLRDYDQSFVLMPESHQIGFHFVAMDTTLFYIIMGM